MTKYTKDQLIAFEICIKELWESGELPFLLHLCGGNEDQLIEIFKDVRPGDWVFSGHRSHYHYLLAGGNETVLIDKIKQGDSMFIFGRQEHLASALQCNFLTSAVLAGTCGIAAGVAFALKEEGSPNHAWCFLGDGAEDEGHFYEAVMFVEANQLPCTFIIEDNDRSVDTAKIHRRGAARMGWPKCVRRYEYTPVYPHAGSGCKFQIQFKNPVRT